MVSFSQEGAECTTFWRLGAFVGSVSKAVTYGLPMNCHGEVSEDFFLNKSDHPCVRWAIPS